MPKKPPETTHGPGELESENISVQLRHVCLEYPYRQLEAATKGFSDSCRLGEGSAATVYLAELPDGSQAAVKVIDLAALGDNVAVAGFEDEIMILSKFRHPNLVVLMGWAKEGHRRFLLYECMTGGDVCGRLNKSKTGSMPFLWHERLSVARDAATGLAHLHNATPRAFHRDIKTANILLGPSGAKMADFGLSCVAKTRTGSAVDCEFPSGTPGYACPIYMQTGTVTEGSEMHSFGMVLLEIILNIVPAGVVNGELRYPLQDSVNPLGPGGLERVIGMADPTAGWPPPVAREVASLALSCIASDESKRPAFNAVCRHLRALLEQFPPTCVMCMHMIGPPGSMTPPVAPPGMQGPCGVAGPCGMTGPRGFGTGPGPPMVPQHGRPPGPAVWMPHGGRPIRGPMVPVQSGPGPPAPGGPMMPVQSGPGPPAPGLRGPVPLPAGPGPGGTVLIQQGVGPQFPPGHAVRGPMPPAGLAGPPARMPGQPPPAGWMGPCGPMAGTAGGPGRPPMAAAAMAPLSMPVEVALEIIHVNRAQLSQMRPEFRVLPLAPAVDGEGRRVARIGRAHQPHWFEAVLLDVNDLNCVSREACEICWGGPTAAQAGLVLRTVGTGLVLVGDSPVPRGEAAPLQPGSRISFATQGEGCVIISLAVHCAALPQVLPSLADAAALGAQAPAPGAATVAAPAPPPAHEQGSIAVPVEQEGSWRLVCVFAQGLAPEDFWALPEAVRTIYFVLPKAKGSGGPAAQVTVGRQHQPEVFETLVREPGMLSSISRSHFRLEATEDGVLVTNLSQNVAVVAQRPLHHGESAEVLDGDTLSFAHSVHAGAAEASSLAGGQPPPQPAQTRELGAAEGGDLEATTAPFLTLRLVGPPPPAPSSNFVMAPPSLPLAAPPLDDDLTPFSAELFFAPDSVASEALPVAPAASAPSVSRMSREDGAPLAKAPAPSRREGGLRAPFDPFGASCGIQATGEVSPHSAVEVAGVGLVAARTAPSAARPQAPAAEADKCRVM